MILSEDNRLFLVDFGIVGRIGMTERRFLAEILYGFIQRDYLRVAEVHFEAGYVPPDKSVGDFAQALRSVGEPIHGRPAEEVSMGRLLLQLLDFTHTFGMHLRPELVLLQKTMVQVEGVARTLDPGHNIWDAAKPIVESWIRTEFGPAGVTRQSARMLKDLSNRALRLPETLDRLERVLAAQDEYAARAAGSDRMPSIMKRPFLSMFLGALVVTVTVLGVNAAWQAFFS